MNLLRVHTKATKALYTPSISPPNFLKRLSSKIILITKTLRSEKHKLILLFTFSLVLDFLQDIDGGSFKFTKNKTIYKQLKSYKRNFLKDFRSLNKCTENKVQVFSS